MTELVINEQMGQPDHLNGHFMKHFADSLGVSLEKLGEEYDDMIKNFELQKAQLQNYKPCESIIAEENTRSPSPTPSQSSQNSPKYDLTKKQAFSSSGIQSSFRAARRSIRRKLSTKNQLSTPQEHSSSQKHDRSSISSFKDSESSCSVEQDGEARISAL